MDPVIPLEWSRVLIGSQPTGYFLEIIVKVIIIYLFALLFLRAGGKRARQQMTPLEVLLIVALGSAVGDVMFYPEVPLIYPALIILSIVMLQYTINLLKRKYDLFQVFINSEPKLVVKQGVLINKALSVEGVSDDEIYSVLRMNKIKNLNEVEYMYLELSGEYSVFKAETPYQDVDISLVPPTIQNQFMSS